MRRLVGPYKVVPLVLVGQVGAVHEQLGVLADLVGDGRVEVILRRLVLSMPRMPPTFSITARFER